ncbi:hypothetical protein [Vibrio sagamiensis]|uniref:Lipoprotein n=1 Tax=Vibrio sagamiensis NBRC 104589 TaxID=1219064 RepID=A0A511QD55_9VIBR|nr:hypothetical protein [Vibrio sagamiensis]PNQ54084.1 hypothetical protein C1141_17765 [Vibrio agarivorans]GEM75240.1 hypothetical protein VSA01S_13520 [Vibrio sagamiensis NBRC 104589]
MNVRVTLFVLLGGVFITACDDDRESTKPNPVYDTSPTTKDIVAARDFNFDLGKTITLSFNYHGNTNGALHIYSKAAYTHPSGDSIGDPRSRLTTVYPKLTGQVELEINSNWKKIYVHWVPMSVSESEQNWVIPLNQSNNNYHIDM